MSAIFKWRLCLFSAGMMCIQQAGAATMEEKYQRALTVEQWTDGKVYRQNVRPHWFDGGSQFWYRIDLADGRKEFIRVHAVRGYRREAFEHARLAEVLAQAAGRQVDPERLPFGQIKLSDDDSTLTFSAFGKTWRCQLSTYTLEEGPLEEGLEEALPPQAEIRPSRNSQEDTSITFFNRTGRTVVIYWIDTAGRRHQYAVLEGGRQHRQHTFVGHVWVAADPNETPLAAFTAVEDNAIAEITDSLFRQPLIPSRRRPRQEGVVSPNGAYRAVIRRYNLFLQATESGQEQALTEDGTAEHFYSRQVFWSPDSRYLAVIRTRKGLDRQVYLVESSPADQLQPKLHTITYPKPGDEIDRDTPCLFDVEARKQIPISDALFANPWSLTDFHWQADSKRFLFVYNQRGHQLLRVLAVQVQDGSVQTLIEETSPTFIDYAGKYFLAYLDETGELIWMSEQDGWNHLYLYDAAEGRLKNQITTGSWPVRQVLQVDDKQRQIWFEAGGVYPRQDPYYLHLCRVNFDGSGFTILTEGDGTHEVEFSPNRRFFLDRYSRVDLPPVTELRSSSDGRLICLLEKADWSALPATGWQPPERFTAKGRDGQTAIYGILIRPSDFDPKEKYPVLEEIYAGPQGAFVPKAFGRQTRQRQLAELGFVVVQIDGMGTSYRSKAFHDVCWKNLGDSGFPDRIAWLKAAGEKYPWLDLTRVGIYGGSAGGQSALRALLAYGEFYKAAAADCGCHDNRMDKIWWNELWMGWPVGPHYEEQSNVTNAHKLQGKLLLTVGELDRNVDPASTMQVVNALIKADKDFELLVVPGSDHGAGEHPYARRKRMDFFVKNLLGVEPPSRGLPAQAGN
ncbi:MAG TPA: DPP IV N-terminal domain-containing protein [Anaerohalosphaeraceae bacterium]|nr:DPP IV N-terminal domain-containing protein [Anaerohalosphaeraceae bacterium]HPB92189.1 DPP IV N-terminal domain-containing protein [Anaerohalosphaeraceae bacterium]HRT23909.1 DPP IV N-terminal domain-containing protein [Anaerohalosphaeraceae bacterium]